MECPNCHNAIPETASFCTRCETAAAPLTRDTSTRGTPGSGSAKRWPFIVGSLAVVVALLSLSCFSMSCGGSESEAANPPPTATWPPPAAAAPTTPTPAPAVPTATSSPRAQSAPATSRGAIVFSEPDWTSIRVQNRIAQYIVEHGYGYATRVTTGSTGGLFQKLRAGDVHVAMEVWLPLQDNDWTQAQASGEVVYGGPSLGVDWQSTFVIPAYLQEDYPGLDHVDDLKDPQYRELFATAASNGKARLVGCPMDWECAQINDAQIAGYGLSGHVEVHRPASQESLFDEIYGSYAKRRPWLGYIWGNADPAILLDVVRLEETPYSDECWFTHKACAFKETTILTGVHSGLSRRAPEIVDLLKNWRFNVASYREVFLWMDENNATAEDAARRWLNGNSDIWRSWVTEDAYAGVRAALAAGVRAEGWPGR